MTQEAIFEVLKESIGDILFDLDLSTVRLEHSLKELGANSIDRMEIVVATMEALGLKIPLVEFGKINNLQGLVEFFYQKKQTA